MVDTCNETPLTGECQALCAKDECPGNQSGLCVAQRETYATKVGTGDWFVKKQVAESHGLVTKQILINIRTKAHTLAAQRASA